MTDIVERLRSHECGSKTENEAADEIERLRGFQDAAADLEDRLEEAEAEIKQLRTALEEIADLSSVSVRAPHIARAALAGKP